VHSVKCVQVPEANEQLIIQNVRFQFMETKIEAATSFGREERI